MPSSEFVSGRTLGPSGMTGEPSPEAIRSVRIENATVVYFDREGKVRRMDDALIEIRDGKFSQVTSSPSARERRDAGDDGNEFRIGVRPSQVVVPPYVNAHLHLTLPPISSSLKPLPSRAQYNNAGEWIQDQDRLINWQLLKANAQESALLNLQLNLHDGVSFVVGHGKPEIYKVMSERYAAKVLLATLLTSKDIQRKFRSGSVASLTREQIQSLLISAGYSYPIVGVHSYYLASRIVVNALHRYAKAEGLPFYGHFGEGVDSGSARELQMLVDDGLTENTVIVHGLAFTNGFLHRLSDFADMRGIVWCRAANEDLFGRSAAVESFLSGNIRIAIGTDSAFAGSRSYSQELIGDLGYADKFGVDIEELFRIACHNGHKMFSTGWSGAFAVGEPANLQIIDTKCNDLHGLTTRDVLRAAFNGRTRQLISQGELVPLERLLTRDEIRRRADEIYTDALTSRATAED